MFDFLFFSGVFSMNKLYILLFLFVANPLFADRGLNIRYSIVSLESDDETPTEIDEEEIFEVQDEVATDFDDYQNVGAFPEYYNTASSVDENDNDMIEHQSDNILHNNNFHYVPGQVSIEQFDAPVENLYNQISDRTITGVRSRANSFVG